MNAHKTILIFAACGSALAQPVETVRVVSDRTERVVRLPGEFLPYQSVDLRARVAGFVDAVNVDRGSPVKKGALLVTLAAPEMKAQLAEAEARLKSQEAQRAKSEARVLAAQSTYDRMKAASATEGAIAANELVQAEKAVEAARASRGAADMAVEAARASLDAQRELEALLSVTAPFDGTVTERFAHPGTLAGPGAAQPLLRLEQLSRLRLVVAVPETEVGGIVRNARVPFTVPAYPGEKLQGVVARLARSLDPKTRTMPVELDVANPGGRLSPGMYPEVQWPVRSAQAVLLVPPTAIVTTTARSFVIRVRNGRAEWVDVRRGAAAGGLVEVRGVLREGDEVILRGNDEIRDGATVQPRTAKT